MTDIFSESASNIGVTRNVGKGRSRLLKMVPIDIMRLTVGLPLEL